MDKQDTCLHCGHTREAHEKFQIWCTVPTYTPKTEVTTKK